MRGKVRDTFSASPSPERSVVAENGAVSFSICTSSNQGTGSEPASRSCSEITVGCISAMGNSNSESESEGVSKGEGSVGLWVAVTVGGRTSWGGSTIDRASLSWMVSFDGSGEAVTEATRGWKVRRAGVVNGLVFLSSPAVGCGEGGTSVSSNSTAWFIVRRSV